MLLSLVMPVYNERDTLTTIIDRVLAVCRKENIGMTDGFEALWTILRYAWWRPGPAA